MEHRGGVVDIATTCGGENILSRYLTLITFLNVSGGGCCCCCRDDV